MYKQKGQAMVEFAFIVPFLIFLFLALVYGGILFMDYIQYHNAARAIARDAAFAAFSSSQKTAFDAGELDNFKTKFFNPLTSLYTADPPQVTINANEKTVTVIITLKRNDHLKLFGILTSDPEKEFPPRELNPIIYTMPIENPASNE